jgi:hypothetical protein
MIMRINNQNEELVNEMKEKFKDHQDVKFFDNELHAFADAEIDTRFMSVGVSPDSISDDTRAWAINVLYNYLLEDETSMCYDGMDDVVREAIKEIKE